MKKWIERIVHKKFDQLADALAAELVHLFAKYLALHSAQVRDAALEAAATLMDQTEINGVRVGSILGDQIRSLKAQEPPK